MSVFSDNIEENDPSKIACRACLQYVEALSLYNLFQAWVPEWEGMEGTIAEDLAKIANIQITESDTQSKYICGTCCKKLQSACEFVSFVQKNDRFLKNKSDHSEEDSLDKVWPKPIQIDKNIVSENSFEHEIKQEVLSDEEYNYNTEDGYRETDTLEIKVEPEEIVAPAIQIVVNGTIKSTDIPMENGDSPIENGEEKYDEDFLDLKVKEEPSSETEDAEPGPLDLPLECLLCTKVFNSVTGLKAHVIAQHSYKSVKRKAGESSPRIRQHKYPCTICKRTFATSTDLMVHETCHNKDVCYGCNAKFDSFESLAEHTKGCKACSGTEVKRPRMLDDVIRPKSVQSAFSQSSEDTQADATKCENESIENKSEPLTCELCNEVFSDSYYMNIHKEIHHSQDNLEEAKPQNNDTSPMEIDRLESIFNDQSSS